jgi:hypothetical protein
LNKCFGFILRWCVSNIKKTYTETDYEDKEHPQPNLSGQIEEKSDLKFTAKIG